MHSRFENLKCSLDAIVAWKLELLIFAWTEADGQTSVATTLSHAQAASSHHLIMKEMDWNLKLTRSPSVTNTKPMTPVSVIHHDPSSLGPTLRGR